MQGNMLVVTLNSLTPHVKQFNGSKKPIIENFAFKLHYQLTVVIFLAFVILVCAREYFGDHIRCLSDQGVPPKVIQTYCFFMATFTIVRHYNESLLQTGFLPHPGVGPMSGNDEILYHTYYQWVPFVLFIQAICFYMPHYIWKKKEGGRIKALVNGLQYASIALNDEDMNINGQTVPSRATLDNKINLIRRDIVLRLRITRTWSTWLVSMEVMNLLHVMFQIWLIDQFLTGHFISLGPRVLHPSRWNDIADPLETIFPKVTKCIFHKYGPSGSIQQHDALCVMALNIIHEKIYTVLWFWLLFLFITSVLAVIWRTLSYILYRRSLKFNQLIFGNVNAGKFDPYNVINVVNGCKFSDWLFLYYLAKNMSSEVFSQLFASLAEELMNQDNIPTYDEKLHEEVGNEPILINRVNYDDETMPLQDVKKSA